MITIKTAREADQATAASTVAVMSSSSLTELRIK
jgi:hypothetical protein